MLFVIVVLGLSIKSVVGDKKMADEVQRHSDALSTIRDMVHNLRAKSKAFYGVGQTSIAEQLLSISDLLENAIERADNSFNDMFQMWYSNVDKPSENLMKGLLAGIALGTKEGKVKSPRKLENNCKE